MFFATFCAPQARLLPLTNSPKEASIVIMAPSETQSLQDDEREQNLLTKPEKEGSQVRERVELKRNLSLLNGIGLIVGTIIGAGIFISPAGVLGNTGSVGLSMCIWFVCGIIASLGALCYCELGTALPSSGGEYNYLLSSYGSIPAFLFSWTAVLVIKPSAIAGVSIVFGSYVTKPFYEDCDPPVHLVKLLGFCCISKSLAIIYLFYKFYLTIHSKFIVYTFKISVTLLLL